MSEVVPPKPRWSRKGLVLYIAVLIASMVRAELYPLPCEVRFRDWLASVTPSHEGHDHPTLPGCRGRE